MKTQVLIIVRGGIVQSVHANKDIEIVIVDYDNEEPVSEVHEPDLIIEKPFEQTL